eukprot:365528-Chlamydomonas_euryale.AAC.7
MAHAGADLQARFSGSSPSLNITASIELASPAPGGTRFHYLDLIYNLPWASGLHRRSQESPRRVGACCAVTACFPVPRPPTPPRISLVTTGPHDPVRRGAARD